MKKLNLFILIAAIVSNLSLAFGQDELDAESKVSIDTIYYNSEWKGVSSRIIADYYRITVEPDRIFRDFFITGELQAKGGYVSIDAQDDSKSIFEGKCINYFRSGKVAEERTYIGGELNGEHTVYNENGLIKQHSNFENGKMDGIYTEFNDDGLCIQMQFRKGEADTYYTVSNDMGCVMKIDAVTNNPIWESPTVDEKQKRYMNGVEWSFYNKNGVVVSVANTQVKDYGRYYQIKLVIANNSLVAIDFDPTVSIAATVTDYMAVVDETKVLSSSDYQRRVKRTQNWTTALVGISEGLAAANAGYRTSTINSNTHSYGSAYANGAHGSAYGSYSEFSNSTATIRQYDAAAAYQARVIASNRVATFEASLLQDRQVKEEGYLKHTTIQPAEIISGYVNVKRKVGEISMSATININGAEYIFEWNY